jgi:hypothetical protein
MVGVRPGRNNAKRQKKQQNKIMVIKKTTISVLQMKEQKYLVSQLLKGCYFTATCTLLR